MNIIFYIAGTNWTFEYVKVGVRGEKTVSCFGEKTTCHQSLLSLLLSVRIFFLLLGAQP